MQTADSKLHFFSAAPFVGEAAVGGFEMSVHFGGGSGEGVFDVGCLVGHDEGGMTFGASFENTAFIFRAGFFDVFAGQVNFDPGEVGIEAIKDVEDVGSDGIGELVVHRDRIVAVDLNLHGPLLCYLSTKTLVTLAEWPENKGVCDGIYS